MVMRGWDLVVSSPSGFNPVGPLREGEKGRKGKGRGGGWCWFSGLPDSTKKIKFVSLNTYFNWRS